MCVVAKGDFHGVHRALFQCLERSSFDLKHDTLNQSEDLTDGFNAA